MEEAKSSGASRVTKSMFYVYLDQNIISRARLGERAREAVLSYLEQLSEKGGHFVISRVNVEESRDANAPDRFLEVVTRLNAIIIDPMHRSDVGLPAIPTPPEQLFLGEIDLESRTQEFLQQLLTPLQFAANWLGAAEADELKAEIEEQAEELWRTLEQQIPTWLRFALSEPKQAMLASINDLDWRKLKDDAGKERGDHAGGTRQSLAETLALTGLSLPDLDAVGAVNVILEHLQEEERAELKARFPRGFWADWSKRECGKLTGFSFMLFMMGLIVDETVRKKTLAKRQRRFLSHFRDCSHIEAASYCQVFLTLDGDAARLATAAYDYAGVPTVVQWLRITGPTGNE